MVTQSVGEATKTFSRPTSPVEVGHLNYYGISTIIGDRIILAVLAMSVSDVTNTCCKITQASSANQVN
jgi:hypothetical protein